MGQSKSKSNIKYEPCPSNARKNTAHGAVISDVDSEDSEDEIDIEIGNLKKRNEELDKSQKAETFSKAWYRGVMFATISGEV